MPNAERFLGPPLTAAYRPAVLGYGMIQSLYTGQVPLFMLGEVEAMRSDPRIQLGVSLLRAPLHRLKVKVKAAQASVSRYVEAQFYKVWNTSMRRMLTYVEYGQSAGEPLFKEESGHVVYDQLRDVYPRDAYPLMLHGGVVGVQVKGAQPVPPQEGADNSGQAQPRGAGTGIINLFPPRAFWVAHRPRNGSPYGYSRFNGAWWPWLEKRGRHGATDIRRGWFVKNAFRGMRIRHPAGMIERGDGSLMSCQDYAREIVEKCEAGGVLALPSVRDEQGNYLWEIEDAAVNGDLAGVREYSQDLDAEMLEGFEIPREVVQAAETGSGWSGRSVPFMVFLSGEDELACELVSAIVRWILRPLVDINFGPGVPFEVEPVSLLDILGGGQEGSGSGGGTPPVKPGQPGQPTPPAPGPAQPPATQPVRMALDDRSAVESASRIVDQIIEQGSQAGILAAASVRQRLKALVRKGIKGPHLVEQARKLLARYEPVLASAFSDSLLAAWLAGAARATQGLPPLPAPGGMAPPSSAPPPPVLTLGRGADEPEPVVRLPLIEAAAADLERRQIVTREEFDQLASEAKSAAFTAAGVASEDALARIADALHEAVAEGGTLAEFTARVEEATGAGALAPGHIENIFRTNVAQAYSTGLMETLGHPMVADEFPYLLYASVHDARRRPEHGEMERLGLDGTAVYRRDDPIWQEMTPPWDYQCRCAVVPLSVEDAASRGVREAKEWLAKGIPPEAPEYVSPPPFGPPPGWATRQPVRMSYEDDEGHVHDKAGRFAPKGKSGQAAKKGPTPGEKERPEEAPKDSPKAAQQTARKQAQKGVKQLLGQKGRIAVKQSEKALSSKLGKYWQKMPARVQKAAAVAHAVTTKVLYAIDTPLRMGLNLAKTVARERGLPEEHVQKVAKVVNAIDQVSTLPVVGPYTRIAKAMVPAMGPIAGYIPVAALTYTAYSTARNPFATVRAARHMVKNFKAAVTTHFSQSGDQDAIAALFEAYDRHQGDDWFDALLHAAIDQTHDLKAAIELAEEARAAGESPTEEE